MVSQENKRIVVATCTNCGGTTSKPEGWSGSVFCRAECQAEYNTKALQEAASGEAQSFITANPAYYECDYNNKLITDRLYAWKQEITAANLEGAYLQLLAERKLLGKLTLRDIDKMTEPEFSARERIDPNLGGSLAEVEARGNAKFAAPQSFKVGGTGGWERMAQANLVDRQQQADARALRQRGKVK